MTIAGGISLGIHSSFYLPIILYIMMFIINHMESRPISHSLSLFSVYLFFRVPSDIVGDRLFGTYMEPKFHIGAKKDEVISNGKMNGHATSAAQDVEVKSNANGSLKGRKVNGTVNGVGL